MRIQTFITIYGMVFFLHACQAQQKNLIDAQQFEQGIASGKDIQILDVRTPGEFNSGHISQALMANWNDPKEFNRRVSFMDKDKPVYVYCLSGGRSHAAAEKLKADGFKEVYELKGGIMAWKSAQKKVEGVSDKPGMTLEQFNGAITSHKIVLVDVGASWCPPCKKMEPVVKKLQEKYGDRFLLLNVDGGKDEELLQHFKIQELPVFMVMQNGQPTWRRDGIASFEELEKALFP